MTMPFYASAEQIMRDRSEYARKGIARGRGVVVLSYEGGILFVAENPSKALHAIFTEQQKPFEVELCVAEVGESAEDDQLYRLTFDGSVVDEPGYVVMGGQADTITSQVTGAHSREASLDDALRLAAKALGSVGGENNRPRQLAAGQLEVAVLDRSRPTRKFKRIVGAALAGLLPTAEAPKPAAPAAPSAPAEAKPAEAKPAGGKAAGGKAAGGKPAGQPAKAAPAPPTTPASEADILADVDATLEEPGDTEPAAGETSPPDRDDESPS